MCGVGFFFICGKWEACIFTTAKVFFSSCSITLNVYSESVRIKTCIDQSDLTSSHREGRQSSTWPALWSVCGISWAVNWCLHATVISYEALCDWEMQWENKSGRVLQQLVQDRHIVSEQGSALLPAFSPMVCSVFLPAPTLIHKVKSLISAHINATVLVSTRGYVCSAGHNKVIVGINSKHWLDLFVCQGLGARDGKEYLGSACPYNFSRNVSHLICFIQYDILLWPLAFPH